MSDQPPERKPRSSINALRILNTLRAEKGLPKVGAKPKAAKLTKEGKAELFRQVLVDLFPEALTSVYYHFTERNAKAALMEFEQRANKIQGEPGTHSGKPRGRKPKV